MMINIDDHKQSALQKVLDALDELSADYSNIDKFSKTQEAISIYATMCLVEKAHSSGYAAAELSKQNRMQARLNSQKALATLVSDIDKLNITSEEMNVLKDKMNLVARFNQNLTEENVRKAMVNKEITVDESLRLFKILQMQKESNAFSRLELVSSMKSLADEV